MNLPTGAFLHLADYALVVQGDGVGSLGLGDPMQSAVLGVTQSEVEAVVLGLQRRDDAG
jgi:hypothetical protein